MRLIQLLPLALIALSTGCTTTGTDNIKSLPDGHRVLVVSALGEQLQVKHTGTTIWGNWESAEDASEWGVDTRIEELLVNRLGKDSRFEAIAADNPSLREGLGLLKSDYFSGKLVIEGGAESLQREARAANADSVLLVGSRETNDVFFMTNQLIRGYGIYQRSAFGMKNSIVYALVDVWLIDTASGEEIASTHQHDQRPCDDSIWVEEGESVSKEDTQELRQEIMELVESLVVESLTDLTIVTTGT